MRIASPSAHFTLTLFLFLPGLALADAMDDFKQTYQAYQQAVNTSDWPQALQLSEAALTQGLKVFKTDGPNVANLRFNFARELARAGRTARAIEQLQMCIEAKRALYGPDSDQLVGPLMELGNAVATTDTRSAAKTFSHAIRIAGHQTDPALTAQLQLEAGLTQVKFEDGAGAKPFLEPAHAFYLGQFGPSDGRAGIAALNLGKIYANEGSDEKARQILTSALKAFTGDAPVSKQFDAGTRRLLVTVLERLGRDEDALPHRIAIARSNAANGATKPELLYRDTGVPGLRHNQGKDGQSPRPSGEVSLAYTVDANGKPRDIVVESSDNKALNDAAIAFVKTFRYAPAIAAGKPVATRNVKFDFRLRSPVPVHVEQ